jgi:hypothetical protein
MTDTPKLTDAIEGDSCPPTCSLLRAWKIEPCGQTGIDTLYMLDDGRWSGVMGQVEYALEQQMESDDGGGKMSRPWNEISVTITGVLLTPEQWEEICDDDS